MSISFHVDFNGQCKEAFEFYAGELNGKIGILLQFRDSPASSTVPESRGSDIVHASIEIEGVELTGADLDSEQYQKPRGFYVMLRVDSEERVKTIFDALKVGGDVIMSPQKTFFSPCYGIVTDRFGIPWKINFVA